MAETSFIQFLLVLQVDKTYLNSWTN